VRRLANALVFALMLALCGSASDAQQPGKVFRVGVLLFPSSHSVESRLNAFREGLRDLGYKEGQNLVLESRFANGDYNQLPVLAGELARLKVDVFFVVGEPVLLAAKEKGF
jgi:putative ABC transport system substrate-binding protein